MEQIVNVKNNGYHPKPRKMKTKAGELFEIQEEPGAAISVDESLEDKVESVYDRSFKLDSKLDYTNEPNKSINN